MIKIKRAYEPAQKIDGYRILVDRLWPRGVSKAKAKLDLWLKDIGPSTGLRKWFNHDPKKWGKFKHKYLLELKNKKELLSIIRDKSRKIVTLVFAAKDEKYNNAVVIKDILSRIKK